MSTSPEKQSRHPEKFASSAMEVNATKLYKEQS